MDNPLIPCAPRARHAARKRSSGSFVVASACFALISSSFCRRAEAAMLPTHRYEQVRLCFTDEQARDAYFTEYDASDKVLA